MVSLREISVVKCASRNIYKSGGIGSVLLRLLVDYCRGAGGRDVRGTGVFAWLWRALKSPCSSVRLVCPCCGTKASAAAIGAKMNGQVKKLQRPRCLSGSRGGFRDWKVQQNRPKKLRVAPVAMLDEVVECPCGGTQLIVDCGSNKITTPTTNKSSNKIIQISNPSQIR